MSRQSIGKFVGAITLVLWASCWSAAIGSQADGAVGDSDEVVANREVRAELVQEWQRRLSHADYEQREQATQDLLELGEESPGLLIELIAAEDLEVSWRARTAATAVFSQLTAQGRTSFLGQLENRLKLSATLPVQTRAEILELIASFEVKTAEVIQRLTQLGVALDMSQDGTTKVSFHSNTSASDSLFSDMRFASRVSSINLARLRITDEQLRHLQHLKYLERLYLKDTGLNGTGLKHLTGLLKLNSISLQGLNLKPEAFDALAQMKNLQYLGLDQTSTTDRDLAKLSGLQHIKQLWLNDTKVSDEGLAAIGNMDGLEKLVLTNLAIDGSGLEDLAALKRLKYLSLEGCPVDDSIMQHLKRFDSLETLGLDKTRVTDKAVVEIKKLKNLKVLWLAGSRVTDQCVPDLLEMQNLERLLLFYCRISQQGFQRLQDGLPNCAINELE